ncbi:carbohydrate esterase family 3 protein [Xylariaceae sp. FL1651]|nr:carbohydrate esterase family 3 protein [Xylariaceae sp. FL1651]
MGIRMGVSKGDDWCGVASTILGRKNSILSALLLVTIGLMIYSFHDTIEVTRESYSNLPSFKHPQDANAESQTSQELPTPISSPEALISQSGLKPPNTNISLEESPTTTSSLESTVPSPLQTVSVFKPLPIPLGGGVPLRVMFLGASVTRGDVSVGNLGFRSPLREKLASLGNPINFVGSQRLGAFRDNEIEAFKGNRIDQIHDHSMRIVPSTKPNVFVLHVGSNDCLQKHDTANAGKRMRDLINYLLKTSPRATVIMSTLLTNTVPSKEPCILDINIQIRKLASALQREGRPVVLAEMHYEQGLPNRPLPMDISPDGTHPFDHGYSLMADIFFEAFLEADRRDFFKSPEENGIPDDGELERAEEPLTYEPEPPTTRPPPPKVEDVAKKPDDRINQDEAKIKETNPQSGDTKQDAEPNRSKAEVPHGE